VDATAVEVELPALGAGTLAVLIEGTAGGAAKRAKACRELLGGDASTMDSAPAWWNRYPFEPGEVALELVAPVDALHAAVYALHDAAGTAVPVRGSAGAGIVHATLPGDLDAAQVAAIVNIVRDVLIARDGSCVVRTAPPAIRDAVDVWGPVPGLELMRRVKEQFDPGRVLSPGRFVGGI
jgi:glycolate oxidase FAD binding subunit